MRDLPCGDARVFLDVEVRRVDCRACGHVRQERLDWLADHPFYTRRFAFFVGRRCRESTVQAVAKELRLDWEAVKSLDVQYMTEQLRRAGSPGPAVIGIDEVSVGRGHSYRIVVSDLLRRRANPERSRRAGSAGPGGPRPTSTCSSSGSGPANAVGSAWP